MAYYHKNLQYHEDTTVKRKMTAEDKEFLRQLQLEMNTQDNTGTRDPRFWVIKGTETFRNSDDPDTYGLMNDGGTVAENSDDVCAYLNENILPYCDVDSEDDHDYFTVEELNEFLTNNGYGELEIFGISTRAVIYPNTMFLTEKDAREHLRSNDYHYSEDAHTYCMSAWRSPVVERLWTILREVQW